MGIRSALTAQCNHLNFNFRTTYVKDIYLRMKNLSFPNNLSIVHRIDSSSELIRSTPIEIIDWP